MHFTSLAIATLASWSAFVSAAPMPEPQFFDDSNRATPPLAGNSYASGVANPGVNAHSSLLGTYHKGQDGTYASNGLGSYEKSNKGTSMSNGLGSIDKSREATTYSNALGSITYGKDGLKLGGPKSKPKEAQQNVPQGLPQGFQNVPQGPPQGFVPQGFGSSSGWD